MTFFEWIRYCLCREASLHPLPRSCRKELKKLLRRQPRDNAGSDRDPIPGA